jgi:hypothetical protein
MEQSRRQHGLLFWIAVVVGSVVVLFVGSAIVAGIYDSVTGARKSNFPPGIVGIQRVDSGTDYVFKDEPSPIGGACTGWKKISIGRRGHSKDDITHLMCWKEINGMVHVATVDEVQTITQPMSAIRSPD